MGTARLALDPSKSIFFMISSQNLFNHCSNSSLSFSGVVSFQRGASFRIVTSSYNCWASLRFFFSDAFTRCYIKLQLSGFSPLQCILISFLSPIFSSFVNVESILIMFTELRISSDIDKFCRYFHGRTKVPRHWIPGRI